MSWRLLRWERETEALGSAQRAGTSLEAANAELGIAGGDIVGVDYCIECEGALKCGFDLRVASGPQERSRHVQQDMGVIGIGNVEHALESAAAIFGEAQCDQVL